MKTTATTVGEYLASLPEERRAAIAAVRDVIRRNLDGDYAEGIQYGMIGYYVPHAVFPQGYHTDPRQPLPFAALASQKNHMAIYLMSVCGDEEAGRFREAYARAGKKLDMGKSCIRFQRLEDLALDVIGDAIRRVPVRAWIEYYVKTIDNRKPVPREKIREMVAARKAESAAKAAARKSAAAAKAKTAVKKKAAAKQKAPKPKSAVKAKSAARPKSGVKTKLDGKKKSSRGSR